MMPSVCPLNASGQARCCRYEKIFCSVRWTASNDGVIGTYFGAPVEPLVWA